MNNNSTFTHNSRLHKRKTITFSSVSLLLTCLILGGLDIWCYLGLLTKSGWLLVTCAILTGVMMVLSLVFFFRASVSWLRACFVILILAALFSWGYYLIVQFGILEYLTDIDKMQEALAGVGWWKYLLFFLFQFLQVTFIPLPVMATTIAGTLMFGPEIASILSLLGVMLGSVVAFVIGDKCGEKVVAWIVGEKQTKKYSELIYDRGKYMFFLMMLFPLFPDDILCLVAGMTTMSYRFFLTTIIITRPIGIIMTCYLGSGEIIPFTGWGLVVWAILVVVMVLAFWATYKYKDKIENIINKISVFFIKKFGSPKEKVFIYLNIKPTQKLLPPPQNENTNSEKVKNKNAT